MKIRNTKCKIWNMNTSYAHIAKARERNAHTHTRHCVKYPKRADSESSLFLSIWIRQDEKQQKIYIHESILHFAHTNFATCHITISTRWNKFITKEKHTVTLQILSVSFFPLFLSLPSFTRSLFGFPLPLLSFSLCGNLYVISKFWLFRLFHAFFHCVVMVFFVVFLLHIGSKIFVSQVNLIQVDGGENIKRQEKEKASARLA